MQLVSKKELDYFKLRICEDPLNILLTIIFIYFSKPGAKPFFLNCFYNEDLLLSAEVELIMFMQIKIQREIQI